jgi:hypothetical protein
MRIAVISDIHDNLWNLAAAIEHVSAAADALICCGDLCSPFVMDLLARFPRRVEIVFGNNDADLFRITRKSSERLRVHGELFETELDGKRFAVNHFDYLARPMAALGAIRYRLLRTQSRVQRDAGGRNAGHQSGADYGGEVSGRQVGGCAADVCHRGDGLREGGGFWRAWGRRECPDGRAVRFRGSRGLAGVVLFLWEWLAGEGAEELAHGRYHFVDAGVGFAEAPVGLAVARGGLQNEAVQMRCNGIDAACQLVQLPLGVAP